MNNCQRCKPCYGGHSNKCCSNVEVIVHPTVHCHEPHRHHHKCVRHIVPVVHHQHHHHHKHHEFEIKRRHQQHHRHHEHGKIERDFCKMDQYESRKGHQNHYENFEKYGSGEVENFDQVEFGTEFDNGSEMFM